MEVRDLDSLLEEQRELERQDEISRRNRRERRLKREKERQELKKRKIRFACGVGCTLIIALIGLMVVKMATGSNKNEKQRANLQATQQTQTQETVESESQVNLNAFSGSGSLNSGEGILVNQSTLFTENKALNAALEKATAAKGLKPGVKDYFETEETIEPLPDSFNYDVHPTQSAKMQGLDANKVTSVYSILVDESTNEIVAGQNMHERMYPASMTKVMTVLVASEYIKDPNELVTITREMTDYSYRNDCSNVGFEVDEQVPVKDLFYGTILPSGAEAALGLATHVAGSHEAFVELMNQKAEELGISDSTHFTNCVGVYDSDHYTTAYDMAIIMKAAVANTWCRQVLSTHVYTTASTTEHPEGMILSNWFLRRIEDKDCGGEVLCGKTGFVNQSRSCAASFGYNAQGVPYVCVTAKANGSWRCIYDHVSMYKDYARNVANTSAGE